MAHQLRILLTNSTLDERAGSELVVSDLAKALRKRGHLPIVYTTSPGVVADELKQACIPVISNLNDLGVAPDIIHGQHHLEAMAAMLHFNMSPAIYVCHGWLPWSETPPRFLNIMKYVAVGSLTRERIVTSCGIGADQVAVIPNFVDLEKFTIKTTFSERPRSAAIFSNAAKANSDYANIVHMACKKAGIEQLDIFGAASNNSIGNAQEVIKNYDIVFAIGRCALEAITMGCALVIADIQGAACMITPENMQMMIGKFGLSSLDMQKLTPDFLYAEIMKYDPLEAAQVAEWMRSKVGLQQAVDRYEDVYNKVIQAWKEIDTTSTEAMQQRLKDAAYYLSCLSPRLKQAYDVAFERKRTESLVAALREKNIEVSFS